MSRRTGKAHIQHFKSKERRCHRPAGSWRAVLHFSAEFQLFYTASHSLNMPCCHALLISLLGTLCIYGPFSCPPPGSPEPPGFVKQPRLQQHQGHSGQSARPHMATPHCPHTQGFPGDLVKSLPSQDPQQYALVPTLAAVTSVIHPGGIQDRKSLRHVVPTSEVTAGRKAPASSKHCTGTESPV